MLLSTAPPFSGSTRLSPCVPVPVTNDQSVHSAAMHNPALWSSSNNVWKKNAIVRHVGMTIHLCWNHISPA
uniref:Uncharacterized protein n=1 Tax=Lynx canadensis TaxID=61383 RepID=A0A667GDA0_LYNCA